MSLNSPVRLFPCLHVWTPEFKCTNYVFLRRGCCVDCQSLGKVPGESQLTAAEIHERFARYLLDKHVGKGTITYEAVNTFIGEAKETGVDDLLTITLDYIFRNFRDIYDRVVDQLEDARDRGPQQWTPMNLADRLERIQREQHEQSREGKE